MEQSLLAVTLAAYLSRSSAPDAAAPAAGVDPRRADDVIAMTTN